MTVAVRNHAGFRLEEWRDSRALDRLHKGVKVAITNPQGRQQQVSVIADSYFLLTTPSSESGKRQKYHRFVEVDLGTEPVEANNYERSSWVKKISAYLEFYRSNTYQALYNTKSMGVLTVTTGERRLASLKSATEAAGGRERFWFATFDRINGADVLTDAMWSVATSDTLHSLVW